ncbi:MAG: hypothetical protein BGO14_06260 [Chlamydiales bacterium 38-26]|nr:ATP-dependent Clp protease ATP-binding subunit [Chlamydiales bacterium]OJV08492.1 MAG: hypothetical protein BGO14_06260 [Chlamydiales bacterium 38-26]
MTTSICSYPREPLTWTPEAEQKHIKSNKKIPSPCHIESSRSAQPLMERVRHLFGKKQSALTQMIKKLARDHQLIKDKDEKIHQILNAIASQDFSSLKKDLKIIINKLSDAERKQLLETALRKDFSAGTKSIGNQCIQLFTLQQMRELIQSIYANLETTDLDFKPQFISLQATAKQFADIHQTIKKYDIETERQNLIKDSKQFFLVRVLKNFVRTLALAFNIIDLGKEPNTYFETKYMLDIVWRLLEIPIKMVRFILSFIVNPLISAAVVVGSAVIASLLGFIFSKLLNRCPDQLPFCKNMIEEVKKGRILPLFGREKELDDLINALAANNETGRKHPLLIGESGVGKSKLMDGLAWRLAKGEVPDSLKGKKLFYIRTSEIIKKNNPFDFKDPLTQIEDKIGPHKKDAILVFEEAHNLADMLGQRFNSSADTSTDSLFYIIGLTTPLEYENKIKNTTLKRRFKKIQIEETSAEQTYEILRHMNQHEAQDIKVSDTVLHKIFIDGQKNILSRHHPDKATYILSEAFSEVRRLQNGGAYDKDMHTLLSQKADITSKLSQEKLHGLFIHSKKFQELLQQLKTNEQNMKEKKQLIHQKQWDSKIYKDLENYRRWHEKWLYKMSEEIVEKNGKVSEILEKLFLLNAYFILPQLDLYLDELRTKKGLEIEVTEDIINRIIQSVANEDKDPSK